MTYRHPSTHTHPSTNYDTDTPQHTQTPQQTTTHGHFFYTHPSTHYDTMLLPVMSAMAIQWYPYSVNTTNLLYQTGPRRPENTACTWVHTHVASRLQDCHIWSIMSTKTHAGENSNMYNDGLASLVDVYFNIYLQRRTVSKVMAQSQPHVFARFGGRPTSNLKVHLPPQLRV